MTILTHNSNNTNTNDDNKRRRGQRNSLRALPLVFRGVHVCTCTRGASALCRYLCVSACVCMYVYIYIYIDMYTCIYIYIYICIYAYTSMYIYIYIYTYIHTHTPLSICGSDGLGFHRTAVHRIVVVHVDDCDLK